MASASKHTEPLHTHGDCMSFPSRENREIVEGVLFAGLLTGRLHNKLVMRNTMNTLC